MVVGELDESDHSNIANNKSRGGTATAAYESRKTSYRAYGVSCRARTGSGPSITGFAPLTVGSSALHVSKIRRYVVYWVVY